MPLRWHSFGRKTRAQNSYGAGQGVELSQCRQKSSDLIRGECCAGFLQLGFRVSEGEWVFCKESNKPMVLRENVGRAQTYKLPGDVGANC